jgi:hypothetical protein
MVESALIALMDGTDLVTVCHSFQLLSRLILLQSIASADDEGQLHRQKFMMKYTNLDPPEGQLVVEEEEKVAMSIENLQHGVNKGGLV